MGDITAANAVLTITVPLLFNTPQQIQGFAADDVYDFDEIENIETLMGVDGILSGGFTNKPQMQNMTLQSDSPSVPMFDTWQAQQQADNQPYPCDGVIVLPAIGKRFIQTNGFLTGYKLTGAKKVLQPVRFRITWNRVVPVPL